MNIKEQIDALVRDVTKVGFMPKSEARRRIMEIIEQAVRDAMILLKEDIETKKANIVSMTHDLKGQCDFERINTLNDVLKLIGNPELSSPFSSDNN